MRKIISSALAVLMLASCNAPEQEGAKILIGTYGESIYEFCYRQNDRSFTQICTIPATRPSFVALTENGLYCVSESDGLPGARSFRNDGSWTESGCVTGNGKSPCHILDYEGLVYTADYTSGSLSVFSTENGALKGLKDRINYPSYYDGSGPFEDRQNSAHVHQVRNLPEKIASNLSIKGNYIFASDLGNDCIHVLTAGDLKAVTDIPCGPGAGPRHMEFDTERNTLYCVTELSDEIIVWKIGADAGIPVFTELQRIKADDAGGAGSADIHMRPDGRFLYASHRLKHDGVSIHAVAEDGTLTKVGYRTTGIHPRNFALTPDGTQAIVACRDSKTLEVYDIDAETGLLSEMKACHTFDQDQPVCVIFE
ncbi:MAG: lactonase family protein [Bacteroidales bacterium]|nr:lactonase family protein [Bacteroidales bacterium]